MTSLDQRFTSQKTVGSQCYIHFFMISFLTCLPSCSRFDPGFVSNASDKKGRYSYEAQPSACRWNLTRLAEALGSELDAATAQVILGEFMLTYEAFYLGIMRNKLGLVRREEAEDSELISDLLRLMHNTGMMECSRGKPSDLNIVHILHVEHLSFQVQISPIPSAY